MEKVKLTQEQAKAIEYALQEVNEYKENPDRLLLHASTDNVKHHNELYPLNTISVVTLAKALYIGYEVEPQYSLNDWVVITKGENEGTVAKIINTNSLPKYPIALDFDDQNESLGFSEIRHATPDEIAKEKRRRWWASHGREVWELKAGDLLKDRITGEIVQVREGKDNRAVIGNYTAYENRDYIQNCYLVTCFVEDRKDR